MYKVLWALVALAAVALATALFGNVVNNNDVRAQSAKVSAIEHKESIDRTDIATLRAELRALSAARSSAP